MLHMFKATQDIIIATKILKRNESFDLSPSSSWQSSTLCDANKLLEKGQISTFLTPYYQICHYLAESEVVSFQWSPTVFKLKFSMKCHLTSSLRKGQPVLVNKTTCCSQLLIQYLLHREDTVIVKLTELIIPTDSEILTKGIRRSLTLFLFLITFDDRSDISFYYQLTYYFLTLGRTRQFIPPPWYKREGVDGTPPRSFRYFAVFRNDLISSGKPLIFLTR